MPFHALAHDHLATASPDLLRAVIKTSERPSRRGPSARPPALPAPAAGRSSTTTDGRAAGCPRSRATGGTRPCASRARPRRSRPWTRPSAIAWRLRLP
ncbi:hypothetical protein E6W17_41195 [Streptomyces sp. A1547]|nr:hypothetical protein E6W17_41195 [Streptomyces sp. A1547]